VGGPAGDGRRARGELKLDFLSYPHEPGTNVVIIFAEKAIPESHHIARPLGVVMVRGGAMLLVTSLLGGMAPGMESM
jgi:hypothetical protein